ncbi:hypothetical protein ACH4VR_40380 [Streptomyces sp. NPDC020883]|uniref:hypothetical protein n=1 Tax=Streptomyces sp. NPDC020883 TaxID=3365099 RepID=UPI00379F676F
MADALGVAPEADAHLNWGLRITHALAGRACLHLVVDAWRLPLVLDLLLPKLCADGRGGSRLIGLPGLRQRPCRDGAVVEYALFDGHGRVMFHVTEEHLREAEMWRPGLEEDRQEQLEWCREQGWSLEEIAEEDSGEEVLCMSACPPGPCRQECEVTSGDGPLHPLHLLGRLHPVEFHALATSGDGAQWAASSRNLRRVLRRLPAPPTAHHRPQPLNLPHPRRPRPLAPAHAAKARREPRVLPLGGLARVPQGRSTEDLAAGLARQLLVLLNAGVVQPGDVLSDTGELGHALAGPRAKTNGALILRMVAYKYGLVRNRARRPNDPPTTAASDRGIVWEISLAAGILAPGLVEELDFHGAVGESSATAAVKEHEPGHWHGRCARQPLAQGPWRPPWPWPL